MSLVLAVYAEVFKRFSAPFNGAKERIQPDNYTGFGCELRHNLLEAVDRTGEVIAPHYNDMEGHSMSHRNEKGRNGICYHVVQQRHKGAGAVVDDEMFIFLPLGNKLDEAVKFGFVDVVFHHDVDPHGVEGFIGDEGRGNGIAVDTGGFDAFADKVLSHDVADEAFAGSPFGVQKEVNMGHHFSP